MCSFESLITKRRSTRKFTNEKLTPEQVESILKAAIMAPTSKNGFSWQFVVVEDTNKINQLSVCKRNGAGFLGGCALAVVVLGDAIQTDVWIEDASIAAIFMQLQAEDLGLGSCWCQVRNRLMEDGYESEQYVRDLLDIPVRFGVLAIIGFGHKNQVHAPIDTSQLPWEKVHTGSFRKVGEIEETGEIGKTVW
jgi:nitroreductase